MGLEVLIHLVPLDCQIPVHLVTVKVGAVHAGELGLAAHAGAVNHDGAHGDGGGDAVGLRGLGDELHHHHGADGEHFIILVAGVDQLLQSLGDQPLAAIGTVIGADDFASMREIVFRRYSRLIAEGAELPDLIIVDGGKGQLSSAYAVLCELGIEKQVPIVGLAKRIEEIFFPGDPMPYYLSRTGEPLKVVCHIRDEAHRFGITFHRQKRSKGFIHSELENIEGVGPKTIELLLRHFRTVEKIRTAPAEELSALIGPAKAARLLVHFGRQ